MSQLVSSQVSLHAPVFSVYPALHVVHVSAEEQLPQLASSHVESAAAKSHCSWNKRGTTRRRMERRLRCWRIVASANKLCPWWRRKVGGGRREEGAVFPLYILVLNTLVYLVLVYPAYEYSYA